MILLFTVLLAWAEDERPSAEIVEATVSAHDRLCSRDVAWHCFTPPDGSAFVVVNADMTFGWTETIKVFRMKEAVSLVVGDETVQPIASGASGLLYDLDTSSIYRPYKWNKEVVAKTREWIFVVPEGSEVGKLVVGDGERTLEIGELSEPPDPRRVAAFEFRYKKWHPQWTGETLVNGARITSHIVLDCEVLEVGLAARALEGAARSYGGDAWRVHTRDFGLSVPGVGVLRPLEELWDKPLPAAEIKHDVKPGDQLDVELLFCLAERPPGGQLLYRGRSVADIVLSDPMDVPAAEPEVEPGWMEQILSWFGM
jgi:hypothetical protein